MRKTLHTFIGAVKAEAKLIPVEYWGIVAFIFVLILMVFGWSIIDAMTIETADSSSLKSFQIAQSLR